MRDITSKPETLREATAEAFVSLQPEVLALIQEGRVAKGDPLEVARVAGIMAAKRTSELLPFCHPLPLTHVEINYTLEGRGIHLQASVKTIAGTGVEMEALTAVSVTALTLYDMLKPHTEEIEITGIRLLSKRGGKSDWKITLSPPARAAVIVLSDSVAAGKKEDTAGKGVIQYLEQHEIVVEHYQVLPDDPQALRGAVQRLVEQGVDLILTVGGTGLSHRDLTVESLRPLIEREIPGITETARAYGQRRTPYAMLSRGIAGMVQNTLIITLPGSPKGAREYCETLFPAVLHIFQVMRGIPHSTR